MAAARRRQVLRDGQHPREPRAHAQAAAAGDRLVERGELAVVPGVVVPLERSQHGLAGGERFVGAPGLGAFDLDLDPGAERRQALGDRAVVASARDGRQREQPDRDSADHAPLPLASRASIASMSRPAIEIPYWRSSSRMPVGLVTLISVR